AQVLSGTISGTGTLTQSGSGTSTLSGTNSYTGLTTISTGVLRAMNNQALGATAGGVTVSDGATLELSGGITIGSETLTLSGSGVGNNGALRNVGGSNSYQGAITLAGTTSIISDSGTTLTLSGGIDGSKALSIAGSGTLALNGAVGFDIPLESFIASSATTLSVNGESLTTVGTQTFEGPTSFGTATSLTSTNSAITATGLVNAAGELTFIAGSGAVSFANVSNNFTSIKVVSASDVKVRDANAMGVSGITATGVIDVATRLENLTISGNISTTDKTSNAVILNAGESKDAGESDGGNIVISGTETILAGSGGIIKLYTGSVSASSSLNALVPQGSGRFRYNSDETYAGYVTAPEAGLNVLYREQPTVTVTADSFAKTYGSAVPELTYSFAGALNGDTSGQIVSSVSVAIGGNKSTSGNFTAGTHTLTPSGVTTSPLGYAVSYSSGTLSVSQLALTVTGLAATSRVYDATTVA
ncbi:MAG: MBG domain-containing protein, partial [Chlorobiaceae bacterium]